MASIQLAPVHTRLLKTWTIVAFSNVASAPHTGDTALFTLASFTLPGGSMGPNGRLRITPLWSFAGAGGTRNVSVYIGGVQVWVINALASGNLGMHAQINIANRNSQASQIIGYNVASSYGNSSGAPAATAIDTSVNQAIDIRGQLANAADSVTLEAYLIELLYGA